MPALLLRMFLPAMLLGTCALPPAHADIYTWTDESGRVNVSNLAPPDGARVTGVVHENAATITTRDAAREAARESLRDAEVRALAERVRQLQDDIERARRQAPPPQVEFLAVAPPVFVPYPILFAPPAQYDFASAPVASGGCGFGWPDCAFGWYPGIYALNVVTGRPPHFRRDPPGRDREHPVNGRGHIAPWLPIPAPGGTRGP